MGGLAFKGLCRGGLEDLDLPAGVRVVRFASLHLYASFQLAEIGVTLCFKLSLLVSLLGSSKSDF